jgi:hypothetical protein
MLAYMQQIIAKSAKIICKIEGMSVQEIIVS